MKSAQCVARAAAWYHFWTATVRRQQRVVPVSSWPPVRSQPLHHIFSPLASPARTCTTGSYIFSMNLSSLFMLPSTVLATVKSSSCVPYCCRRSRLLRLVSAVASCILSLPSLQVSRRRHLARPMRLDVVAVVAPLRLVAVASRALSPLPCAFRPHHLACPVPVAPFAPSPSPRAHRPRCPARLGPIAPCASSPSPRGPPRQH